MRKTPANLVALKAHEGHEAEMDPRPDLWQPGKEYIAHFHCIDCDEDVEMADPFGNPIRPWTREQWEQHK